MTYIRYVILIFILVMMNNFGHAQTTGPEKGALIVVGGRSSDDIIQYFIETCGADAKIVIIPTAAGRSEYNDANTGVDRFKLLGATNVKFLHANSKAEANEASFVADIEDATGIWFGGGRQWRLVDQYAGTKSEKAFWKVLDKGGVIGGSSAGATIQGSYLARGDTKTNQIMMGDHEIGFGFIKNVTIDQHVLARNRHYDNLQILKKKPELLGLSIDEATAIVVKGNKFEVIGDSYVLVYDGSFWSKEGSELKQIPDEKNRFYFLSPGNRYDMLERKVIE